ncbi:MAG: alpha/beta hydrolase [Deltaproteobacteria bacterium]|nr:alpha/beta hydrolase [Deltaproteobacteria bacterium]
MLDEQTEKMLANMREAGAVALHEMPVNDARAALSAISADAGHKGAQILTSEDRKIPGPNGPVPIRIYSPRANTSNQPVPLLVFYHGGGFVLGDIDTHESITRYLCEKAQAVVISVDYRLAPENPFPAGAEDCYAALVWATQAAGELGADPARIAVAGDSAGGNLAAAVCLMSRDRKGPAIALQLLIYPGVDMALEISYPSYEKYGGGEYFLSLEDMKWFGGLYFSKTEDAKDMRASPLLHPDLSNLPPALIVTAGHDPLCDQGRRYADRLDGAGVLTEYQCFTGTIHGFLNFAGILSVGVAGMDRLVRAMKDHLK